MNQYLQVLVRSAELQLGQQQDNGSEGMFPNICYNCTLK